VIISREDLAMAILRAWVKWPGRGASKAQTEMFALAVGAALSDAGLAGAAHPTREGEKLLAELDRLESQGMQP
jgi:hypothetical protein